MKNTFLLGLLIIIGLMGQAQNIDPANSFVTFEISNFKVSTVEGKLGPIEGKVMFDENNPSASKFDVTIPINSINTDSDKRDEHLQGEDYFNTASFSKIRFVSTSVEKSGTGYIAKGTLSMKGTEQPAVINFTSISSNGNTTLTGNIEIDRTKFAVGSDGGFSIGAEVEAKIVCVLIR